ncbi:hypothetical protein UFOVP6_41 [uncultured Caudovirales phage]|uniref:S-adenosyl-L-methionine-dependent methyltransferase n=1 Tax=uncultured Caudovirales phage TaxID=2100421 RepID=A0A6J5KJ81_9CAUD|nr:hypothetical protein UFOVP6_41 [uncultured Caudovirales phage]
MRVLVACEFSGTVRRAFAARGHRAVSCDLLPAEDNSPDHYQGDVCDLLDGGWDLMVCHPPCTYLTNSGVVWLHKDPARWQHLDEGAALFRLLLNAPVPRIAVENPVMHKYAKERIGNIRQSQVVQPWMFGHMEQKATCLWLKNLPLLTQTNNVREPMMALPKHQRERLHYMSPGPNRWKERSRTFDGLAQAMADQWGSLQ